jgi:hypothetical protein
MVGMSTSPGGHGGPCRTYERRRSAGIGATGKEMWVKKEWTVHFPPISGMVSNSSQLHRSMSL